MIDTAFDIVCTKVENALTKQGFARQTVSNTNNDEKVALFTSEGIAYTVVYFYEKKHMVLRSCGMTDEGPDNEWKTAATWMFDPEVDTEKEAGSIGNDFAETVSAPVRAKINKTKKKKKTEEGNADPLFLAKRFMAVFPELRDEIKTEVDSYEDFRGVTFARASIVPKVNNLLARSSAPDIQKLAGVLNLQYDNGDMDTRSIITIVILNSVDSKEKENILMPQLSDSLQKAWKSAMKMKGKNIKPEKRKVKKPSMMERLQQQ